MPQLLVDRPFGKPRAGRSPAVGRDGMVAASQPLASEAGRDVLQAGGNAFDAAVATAAVLTVVEPMMTSLGGDAFVLAHVAATGELVGLNASGFSPAAVTPQFFRDRGLAQVPQRGAFAVSVPGAVDGWETLLARYGSMSLADVLGPAIRHAEEGFAGTEIIAGDWNQSGPQFAEDAEFNRVFLNGQGEAPRRGEMFRNPDLAKTLRQIADGGAAAFYEGEAGQAIVGLLSERDWPMTLDDLKSRRSDWVQPISTTFRDVTLYELPPNGQGMAALEMLNILEPYELETLGHNSAEYLHLLVEAKKLAFGDLDRWLADPEQTRLPIGELISKEHGARQRERIDHDRAADAYPSILDAASDTVYLSVVDGERNAVSFIQSIRAPFGSGLVAPGTGVLLQNRGSDFTLRPGHPNEIGPRKRPYHTIIPAMAYRDGKPWLCFGVMGGLMQPQGHVQVLLNRLLFGMNVQEAGDAPRFCHSVGGLALESGVPSAVVEELSRRGHSIGAERGVFGGYQAVEIDWDGERLIGATESRKDGVAVGW